MELEELVRRTGRLGEGLIQAYSVADLRREFKKRGIDTKGKKEELRDRFRQLERELVSAAGGGGGGGAAQQPHTSAEEAGKAALKARIEASKGAALQRRNSASKVRNLPPPLKYIPSS